MHARLDFMICGLSAGVNGTLRQQPQRTVAMASLCTRRNRAHGSCDPQAFCMQPLHGRRQNAIRRPASHCIDVRKPHTRRPQNGAGRRHRARGSSRIAAIVVIVFSILHELAFLSPV